MPDHPNIPDGAPPDLTPFELDVALLTLSTTDASTEALAAALDIEPAHFLHTLARPHVAAFIQAAVALDRFRFDRAATRAHAEALEALATVARNRDNDIQKRARAATAILRAIRATEVGSPGKTSPRATDRCSERSVSPRSKLPHTDTLTLLTTALQHFTEASPGADTPDPEATTLDQIYTILPAPDPATILEACALPLRRAGVESALHALPLRNATLTHTRDTFADNGRAIRECTFTGESGAITLEFTLHNFGYRTQRWRITDITRVDPTRTGNAVNDDTIAHADEAPAPGYTDADLRNLTLPELNALLQQALPANDTHPP